MAKKTRSVNLDERILSLSKKLGINRSQAAENGIKAEIALQLKTLNLDIHNLELLASGYFAEQTRQQEATILAAERLEQQEYAKKREKELLIERNQQLRTEFKEFCKLHHLRESEFTAHIQGDSIMIDGDYFEDQLSRYFVSKDLPGNLNMFREALIRPVKAVIR